MGVRGSSDETIISSSAHFRLLWAFVLGSHFGFLAGFHQSFANLRATDSIGLAAPKRPPIHGCSPVAGPALVRFAETSPYRFAANHCLCDHCPYRAGLAHLAAPTNRSLVRGYSPGAGRVPARFYRNRYLCARCRSWAGLGRSPGRPHETPGDPGCGPDSSCGCSGPDGSQRVDPRLDAKSWAQWFDYPSAVGGRFWRREKDYCNNAAIACAIHLSMPPLPNNAVISFGPSCCPIVIGIEWADYSQRCGIAKQ